MIVYLIALKPFVSSTLNVINVVNELILLLAFVSILLMNLIEFSDNLINIIGWFCIAGTIVSLLIAWFMTIPATFKAFCGSSHPPTKEKPRKENEWRTKTLPKKIDAIRSIQIRKTKNSF